MDGVTGIPYPHGQEYSAEESETSTTASLTDNSFVRKINTDPSLSDIPDQKNPSL